MRVTLEHLKQFQAVVRFGNLNLAATKINISASAISRSIKIIEEDLGFLLFARQGRVIILNLEGERFYQKSLSLIEDYQILFSDIKLGEIKGTFKIGASHWLAGSYLPSKFQDLSQKNTHIKFELLSQDSNLLVSKVITGELDMAICFSPKDHPEINSHELKTGQLALCSGLKHPLVSKDSKTVLKSINDYEAIIHKPNELIYSCDDHPMFVKYEIKPTFKFYWDSDFIAINLLKSGQYWSLIPDIIVNNTKELKKLAHPKIWDAPYSIKAIWNKKRPLQHLNVLLEAIR